MRSSVQLVTSEQDSVTEKRVEKGIQGDGEMLMLLPIFGNAIDSFMDQCASGFVLRGVTLEVI